MTGNSTNELTPDERAVIRALTSSLTLSVTLENLREALAQRLPVTGIFANILMRDPDRIQFLAKTDIHFGPAMMTESVNIPAAVLAMRQDQQSSVLRVDHLEDDPFTAYVAPQCIPGIRSFLMVRCRLEGRHFGIVCFWSSRDCAFSEADQLFLGRFVNALTLNLGLAVTGRLRHEVEEKQRETEHLRARLDDKVWGPLNELLRRTPSLHRIARDIRRVAPYDATVLITGESGTGKEVVATVIQQIGPRAHQPFVKVNCAAIAPGLIESELFGYEKGAFTGATTRHPGLFEQADGGTLFLDEIGELSPEMQVKLLRVLQQQTFRRVGGEQEIAVNVRIIAATNRSLRELVNAGRFRLDLLYRLAVVPIHLPALSERPEDLAPLGEYFLSVLSRRYGISPVPVLSEKALQAARSHAWLGNVREWRNVLARALLSGQNPIETLDFDLEGRRQVDSVLNITPALAQHLPESPRYPEPFEQMQREYFSRVLLVSDGKIAGPGGAAEITGLHPNTLRSRLEKLGLLNTPNRKTEAAMREAEHIAGNPSVKHYSDVEGALKALKE